ncbi:hypothetical protein F5051DRAFT_447359 [Lentinula edodes]|nr:hypothetical protein F5051DRAFT_447359 [Lentinula edodes]
MFLGSAAGLFRGQSLGDLYAQPIDQQPVHIPGHQPGLFYRLLSFCPAQGLVAVGVERSAHPMNGEQFWDFPPGPQNPAMAFLFSRIYDNPLKSFHPQLVPQWRDPDALIVRINGNIVPLVVWDETDVAMLSIQLGQNPPSIVYIPHETRRRHDHRPPLDIPKMWKQKVRRYVKMASHLQHYRQGLNN